MSYAWKKKLTVNHEVHEKITFNSLISNRIISIYGG